SDDVLQQPLAIDERRFGEVVSLAIQHIEDVVPEAIPPADLQVRLQIVEARNTVLILDDNFAVDQGGAEPKLRDSVRGTAKTRCPVERLAREQARFAPVHARLDSIAVVLDLVNPFWTARGLVAGRREAWLQEGRQQALACARGLADVREKAPSPPRGCGALLVVAPQRACRGKLLVGASADVRGDFLIGDFRVAGFAGEPVVGLDEKPGLGLLPAPRPHADEMPITLEPRTVEPKGEVALGEPLVGIALRNPAALIPHDH